jgi:ribosome-binding factor A
MSERTARLDELLREEISAVIRREVDDPRIGFVTITDVEVSPDLRHASVWVSVIGSADEKRQTLRALSRAMPFVRRRLGVLRLKRIPELHVKDDTTSARGTRVLQILDELEQGGEGDVPKTPESLPTPTGSSAIEHVEPAPPRRKRPRR